MLMRSRLFNKESGLASVEMAFVTPVLLIFMLITAEFTRAFYEYNTLTKSVRDAARFLSLDARQGSIFGLTAEDRATARNIATYGNIAGTGEPLLKNLSTADFDINEITSLGVDMEHIEVRSTYTFQPLWGAIPAIGFFNSAVDISNITLSAGSTMRALQ